MATVFLPFIVGVQEEPQNTHKQLIITQADERLRRRPKNVSPIRESGMSPIERIVSNGTMKELHVVVCEMRTGERNSP